MRNLKKVLSLVLAVAMMVSICVVGAGAVNYDDFKDEGTITKKQAVETLVSLDVLNGYNGGETFAPTQPVTRAEMATIICRILAGGESLIPDATKEIPTYADIDGHWAESYIEYCTSLGIVSGKGNGIFDPQANVTAAEAAKMVMTTLGYNADIEGFKGAGWDINTMAKANTLKLTANLVSEISANNAITREQVAQLIYNALTTPIVQNYTGTVANTWISSGKDAYQETLLETKFNAQKITGVVVANEYADLADDEPIKKGTTRLALLDGDGDLTGKEQTFNVSTELLDIGQSIIVYWNDTTKKVVYGDYQDTGMNVVEEFTAEGDITNSKDFENSVAKGDVKNAECYINYDNAENSKTVSDYKIKYFGVWVETYKTEDDATERAAELKKLDGYTDVVTEGLEVTYTYTATIKPGNAITDFDLANMKDIFDYADKVAGGEYYLEDGAVYVGTQSTKDVSDTMSWKEFKDEYLDGDRTVYALNDVKDNENGNYIRVVDFNNDGEYDYVLKITFTMTEVVSLAKNGNVTVSYYDAEKKEMAETTIKSADYVASEDLAKGDIVITTTIDGITYIDLAESFTGEVDSYNMKKDILTVEGTEYEESGIVNDTNYEDTIANAEKKTEYTYYLDHFGYIRIFAYPTEAEGNYLLLTDGWYRAVKSRDDEYAVQAFLDGELQDIDVNPKKTGDFIDESTTLNNNWGALVGFNDYDDHGTGKGEKNYTGDAVTNVAAYSLSDDDILTLKDVKTYNYDKKHNEESVNVDYVDLDETALKKGQSAYEGTYVLDAKEVVKTDKDGNVIDPDTEDVIVQATKDTVFYYVTLKTTKDVYTVKSVKMVTGYKNTLNVSDKADIHAMYAVATNTSKDAKGENYWVADVIVVELTGSDTEYENVFFNIYAEQKNVKDTANADVILNDGTNPADLLLVDIKESYNAFDNGKMELGFYQKTEADDDDIVKVSAPITKDYAKYGIYAAKADRVNSLMTYLTTVDGKTVEYKTDEVTVYGLTASKFDKYGDPIVTAVTEIKDKTIDVKPGDEVIVFCDGKKLDNVVYVINVTKSVAESKLDTGIQALYDDIANPGMPALTAAQKEAKNVLQDFIEVYAGEYYDAIKDDDTLTELVDWIETIIDFQTTPADATSIFNYDASRTDEKYAGKDYNKGDSSWTSGMPDDFTATGNLKQDVMNAIDAAVAPVKAEEAKCAKVSNEEELAAAVENDEVTSIELLADIELTEQVIIPENVSLNGNGKTIDASAVKNTTAIVLSGGNTVENVTVEGNTRLNSWDSNYGIQLYGDDKEATLKDVTVTGFDAAILVNGATLTVEGTVDVSGNEFGGIEVSKGTSITKNAKLIVDGTVVNSTESETAPTAWTEVTDAKGTDPQGSVEGAKWTEMLHQKGENAYQIYWFIG